MGPLRPNWTNSIHRSNSVIRLRGCWTQLWNAAGFIWSWVLRWGDEDVNLYSCRAASVTEALFTVSAPRWAQEQGISKEKSSQRLWDSMWSLSLRLISTSYISRGKHGHQMSRRMNESVGGTTVHLSVWHGDIDESSEAMKEASVLVLVHNLDLGMKDDWKLNLNITNKFINIVLFLAWGWKDTRKMEIEEER